MRNAFIKNVVDNFYEVLLKKENVTGIACGKKIKNNIKTNEECITVFVSKKVDETNLSKNSLIPNKIKNIKTDVVEVGDVKALSLTDKIRPVKGGYCISPIGVRYSGTAGCLVADKDNIYILSNNHVLADCNRLEIGSEIVQPSIPYGGKEDADIIAELYEYVKINFMTDEYQPINYMDAAIAKVINYADVTNSIYNIGNAMGTNIALNEDDLVKKAGMTTEVTYGRVMYTDAYITVGYDDENYALFSNQIVTTSMIRPGDSGSILLDDNNFIAGLGFAGSDITSVFTPINFILQKFEVTII